MRALPFRASKLDSCVLHIPFGGWKPLLNFCRAPSLTILSHSQERPISLATGYTGRKTHIERELDSSALFHVPTSSETRSDDAGVPGLSQKLRWPVLWLNNSSSSWAGSGKKDFPFSHLQGSGR